MSEGESVSGEAKMSQDSKNRLVAAIAAVGAVVLVLILVLPGIGKVGESDARSDCEDYVDARLKAPASADYELVATQDGEQWTVTGTVDSENSFGAQVRSEVVCKLHYEDGSPTLDDLAVG